MKVCFLQSGHNLRNALLLNLDIILFGMKHDWSTVLNGGEPLIQCTVATSVSVFCRASTAVQVEQTKQGVRSPAPPPHQKRICFYGALLQLPLGNTALFLNRQGHWELLFSNRQPNDMHICMYKTNSCFLLCLPLYHWYRQVWSCPLITDEPLCLFLLVCHSSFPSKAFIKTPD